MEGELFGICFLGREASRVSRDSINTTGVPRATTLRIPERPMLEPWKRSGTT